MIATRKITGLAIAASAVLAGAPWAFTQAVFTNTETVGGNAFTTGTIDLGLSATNALLTVTTLMPGEKVTAPLTVTNSGTGDLRYALSSSASPSVLADGMTGTIRTGVTLCNNAGFSLTGSQLTTGTLSSLSFGSSAQGAQAGDRALSAGANEVLCFQAELPLNAGNALQGLSSTVTFTFSAEQTANN
jgi:spore coat-associated protein N